MNTASATGLEAAGAIVKPCPFCGAHLVEDRRGFPTGFYDHPENDCWLRGSTINSNEPGRLERWNHRASDGEGAVASDFMSLAAHLAKVNAGRPVVEGSETGVYVHRDVCIEAMQALLASSPTPPTAPGVREALFDIPYFVDPTNYAEATRVAKALSSMREYVEAASRDGAGPAYWPTDDRRFYAKLLLIHDAALPLSALPAQPNSSERQKALDAAADLIDGWTTAANTRHLQGWGVHTNAVADMLAKRDAEIATAIRALATNPEPKS